MSICYRYLTLVTLFSTAASLCCAEQRVDYAKDIRPILANKCYACHGPDEAAREADLRFDLAESRATLSQRGVIAPGDPNSSEMITRVESADPDMVMPPGDSGLTLSDTEVTQLKEWIAAGARFDKHWAFRKVTRPNPPPFKGGLNDIDRFVLARLEAASVQPSPAADRPTLIRRVFLDVLGVLPSPGEVTAFVTDSAPDAYTALVERVLANPHYGERWGRHWLDQARYADTNGYTVDSERSMWPFRDWVINSLNADMSFDRFTIEQLAGDLLPSATQSQLVATGFHRNTLINQEGGTDKEQFRNEAVVDRVNTTSAVWMGLTVGCAQCHDHKFDPLTTRDYYRLFAFFNSQQDVNSAAPTLQLTSHSQRMQLKHFDDEIASAKADLAKYLEQQPGSSEVNAATDRPDPRLAILKSKIARATRDRKELARRIPVTMVMAELVEPRESHILIRGDFLRPGPIVDAGVPKVLPPLPVDPDSATGEARRNRLDLAKWLVSRDHPLTARVTVNRIWGHYFGRGLVETENDFGIQGTLPSHPQLLDWLSTELIRNDWSLKHLHRVILTSATYQRSSHARPDLQSVDPLNELLARQNRLRVEAEIIRDISLSAAGLLSQRIGGPSVRPPQPDGVYSFTQRQAKWATSQGAQRYRRGIYTFFMRSAPYPMLTTFDTPRFNTTCTLRVRSNTPLQSLTMANDQTMLDCVRALGRRLYAFDDRDPPRIKHAYEVCFSRAPEQHEVARLIQFITAERREYSHDVAAARALISAKQLEGMAAADLASLTSLARVLLNLDEFIVRE